MEAEMEMAAAAAERRRRLSFVYRSRQFVLAVKASCSLQELGEELQSATGISPPTMKLLVPRVSRAALEPFNDECAALKIDDCGIDEGKVVRVMGALPSEIAEVSGDSRGNNRQLGFDEEEERALRRAAPGAGKTKIPSGSYVFENFRTLQLPGVEMTPPPSEALKLLHALASDRGIVGIMNKYRWRVGILTEMAPEGLVGISPKCLLGFNKNRGQEISLRLRTDDLKGFRKYESIKKTLLHELAHMVHDEHDEDFHQLDKLLNKESIDLDWTRSRGQNVSGMKHQLNKESIDLDWTRSRGQNVSGMKHQDPDRVPDREMPVSHTGHRLGGQFSSASLNIKVAAANAALNRLQTSLDAENSSRVSEEPDPDDEEAAEARQEPDPDDNAESLKQTEQEPDPDEDANEPDPDELGVVSKESEPDPDETAAVSEPDHRAEPEHQKLTEVDKGISEPDPDDDGSVAMEVDGFDDELKRINDTAAATSSRLEESIATLTRQATPTQAMIAFQTLVKILSNVMEHPNEERYRRIKKDNPVFQERVAKFAGAIELLKMVGFTEEAAMSSFVLKSNDPGLLWLARSLVTSALSSY